MTMSAFRCQGMRFLWDSETKLLTSNFSPFSLFRIVFLSLSSIWLFFFSLSGFSSEFPFNSSFPPVFPLVWCATELPRGPSIRPLTAEHRHSQLAGRGGQPEGDGRGNPAGLLSALAFAVIHLSPRHGKSSEEGTFLRSQLGVVVFTSELEGSSLSHPPFIWKSKKPIYPTPASTKHISLLSRSKGTKRSKISIWVWLVSCTSATLNWLYLRQARQVSKCGWHGELEGPSRARLTEYFWTDW